MKKRCLVIPGIFVPANDTITLLSYKHLRKLPFLKRVIALSYWENDEKLQKQLESDPCYQDFDVTYVDTYQNTLFSIRNINLFKALYHKWKYVKTAVQAYQQEEFIYTSTFPTCTIQAAHQIKKKNPDVKWIASFSDPINHSPYKFDQRTYRGYSIFEKVAFHLYCHFYVQDDLEAVAFENADILVFICEEQKQFMLDQYEKYYHRIDRKNIEEKCVIVPLNMIDDWMPKISHQHLEKTTDTYHLAHFGRVYGLRIIEKFIQAVARFCKDYPNIMFVIDQYGEFQKSDRECIRTLGLENIFHIHDKISYEECLNRMNESDGVLIFDTILPEDTIQPYLPSKLMEYAYLQKDTLAISTSTSPTYRIMKQSNGIVARYDEDEIYNALVDLLVHHKTSKIQYPYNHEQAIQPLLDKLKQKQ